MVVKLDLKGNFSLQPPVDGDGLSPSLNVKREPVDVMSAMWREMDYSDFSIVARGGKEIRCHRSVLSAASPVLKGLIATDMEEGPQGFYNIDEREEDLRALLQYMYNGRGAISKRF